MWKCMDMLYYNLSEICVWKIIIITELNSPVFRVELEVTE